jgi:transcriptional regulator with XRE-family HTH domain
MADCSHRLANGSMHMAAPLVDFQLWHVVAKEPTMTAGPGPMVTRRRLRTELRRLRDGKGLAQEYVADEMEWSVSKLIRIENGSVGISTNDLRALLELYGVDEADRGDLVELSRASRQRMWWSRYQKFLAPTYLEFIGFEADASVIRTFQPMILPGLLQTEAYARAINAVTSSSSDGGDGDEARIQVRLNRQQEIFGAGAPPVDYQAVIDESVLRRPVGGAGTMSAQLDHLVAMGRRPSIEICVLPVEVGAHPGMTGGFSILTYTDDADADVVYLDGGPNQVLLREQTERVNGYRRAFDRILELSVRGDEAIELIEKIRS